MTAAEYYKSRPASLGTVCGSVAWSVVVEPEVEVEPEVIVEEATLNHFTEEHKRSLIQAKVDLILKVDCLFRYIQMNYNNIYF